MVEERIQKETKRPVWDSAADTPNEKKREELPTQRPTDPQNLSTLEGAPRETSGDPETWPVSRTHTFASSAINQGQEEETQ
jgi:hypothetical protein